MISLDKPVEIKNATQIDDDQLKSLINTVGDYLGLKNITISVAPMFKVPVQSDGVKVSAFVDNPYSGFYAIYVNPEITRDSSRWRKIISHEMVHIKQREDGRLSGKSTGTAANWEGKDYTFKTQDEAYATPWEKEARKIEFQAMKHYKKTLREARKR